MRLDILFVDVTAYKYYDNLTIDTEPLGGTEASLVRHAHSLAEAGYSVGVVNYLNNMDVMYAGGVYYIPFHMLDKMQPEILISLRGTFAMDKFPRAKKFSWHQDVPTIRMHAMVPTFKEYDVTVVGVSKWHKQSIQSIICDKDALSNPRVRYVYNPVPANLFIPKEIEVRYSKRKLIWCASPHKGLDKGIELFNRLVDILGDKLLELHVFNPGYFQDKNVMGKNIVPRGALPAPRLWQEMSESLCVFYPTEFEETFGCIAAEANAVHCPIATNAVAALTESVAGGNQLSPPKDWVSVLKKVELWYNGDRPKVFAQERFSTKETVKQWEKLF